MVNTISKKPEALFPQAEKAAAGLHALHGPLGIMHNTEALVLADLAAARAKNRAYQSSKSGRRDVSKAQKTADQAGREFILAARDSLKRKLGQRYSQAWDAVGFTRQSIAVPTTIDGRKELLKSMELYFTANPQHEVASENITAAQAGVLHAAHFAAVDDVDTSKVDRRDAKTERDDAIAALQDRLRNLYHELGQFLDEHDPRWLKFGFNVPGDDTLPDAPADLHVAGGAPGHLVPRWSPAPRAERYRVFKQVVGVDADFVLALTVTDPLADMNTFKSGTQVKVRVTAINAAGESQPTEAVETVVP